MSSLRSNSTEAKNCVDAITPENRKRIREESSYPSDEWSNEQTSVHGNVDFTEDHSKIVHEEETFISDFDSSI